MLATSTHTPYQHNHSQPAPSANAVSTQPSASHTQTPPSSTSSATQHAHHLHNQGAASPRPGPTATSPRASQTLRQFPAQVSATSSATPSSASSVHTHSAPPSPKRVKIKDLGHIQSFVEDENSVASKAATGQVPAEKTQELPQYEISGMPVTDVIEMVAGLLTKITSTNDDQAERLHKSIPSPDSAAKMNPLANSVLAFHGKNVPTISIMSYLSRIHKYCPATYEVFLSLLVYFDRITEKINSSPRLAPSREDMQFQMSRPMSACSTRDAKTDEQDQETPASSKSNVVSSADESSVARTENEESAPSDYPSPPPSEPDPMNMSQCFVVDSFNIHRLIIAGVTCASKFFSDVFYTNSRYAKVGGLPLPELNNLEVQFLLLNDFRLSIPVEELEAYGTMLVEFYAREVISQRHDAVTADGKDGGK